MRCHPAFVAGGCSYEVVVVASITSRENRHHPFYYYSLLLPLLNHAAASPLLLLFASLCQYICGMARIGESNRGQISENNKMPEIRNSSVLALIDHSGDRMSGGLVK
ncbi:hypothetical protein EJB05_35349, partial [Eragrostis curvula]